MEFRANLLLNTTEEPVDICRGELQDKLAVYDIDNLFVPAKTPRLQPP